MLNKAEDITKESHEEEKVHTWKQSSLKRQNMKLEKFHATSQEWGARAIREGKKKHGGNSMVLSLEFFDVIFPWQREVAENEKAVYS